MSYNHNERFREESPRVTSNDPLVSFLYLLLRDHLQPGNVVKLVADSLDAGEASFTNGWLAQMAEFLVRSLSRRKRGSKNRCKQQLNLAKIYRRIRRIRKDLIHKASTALARTKSIICLENLNVKGMVRNHNLAKAISDLGFREFRRQLEYKTKWYGSTLSIVDRWFPSSKMCHCCGYINHDLTLNQREWTCFQCGAHLKRDPNAALNIRNEGVANLSGHNIFHWKERYRGLRGKQRLGRGESSTAVASAGECSAPRRTKKRPASCNGSISVS